MQYEKGASGRPFLLRVDIAQGAAHLRRGEGTMASTRRRQFLAAAGAALASPFVRGQRPAKVAHLGFLTPSLASLRAPLWEPFFAAMRQRGWREGVEYVLVERETRGDPARALELAKELVGKRVDLVLAIATAPAMALKQVSGRIPVITWCGYPVEAGLAASLARPGGNITGVANYAGSDVWGKFVELLREQKPGLRDLGVLWDYAPPAFPDGPVAVSALEQAAQRMGVSSRIWMIRSEKDLDEALSALERAAVEAIVMTTGGGFHNQPENMKRIGALLARRRLPAITDVAALVFQASCVLAYSPNVPEILTRLADFTDRVLRGAHPGELPFERPSRFELAINLKAARAMGLAVPQALLLRADTVIE
jgi:putative ABC transport system substrate-binding protein